MRFRRAYRTYFSDPASGYSLIFLGGVASH